MSPDGSRTIGSGGGSVIATDVLVVGAGSSGFAAAVASAESGASTVLVDGADLVGGTLSNQLLESSAGFTDRQCRLLVGGVAGRLVRELVRLGSSPGHVPDYTGYSGTRLPVNHYELALCESAMLSKAGVRVLLRHTATEAGGSGERQYRVRLEGPGGSVYVHARAVVDCTGDADMVALLGGSFQSDGMDRLQPASLLFKIGDLNFERLLSWARANPGYFRPGSTFPEPSVANVHLWGFGPLLRRAFDEGALDLRRQELHFSGWPNRREAVINATRVAVAPLDGESLGARAADLSRQVLGVVEFFRRYVPGGEECRLIEVANRIGVRESRRILGEWTLTEDEIRTHAVTDDSIALCAFPIDIHDNVGPSLTHTELVEEPFGIPFGCLVPRGTDSLFVAGRSISTTHVANGSIRQTAQCFATGEAAGVAAALACRGSAGQSGDGVTPRAVRSALVARGAIVALD